MKKIITTTIATGLVASSAMAGASVTADFASAYVFRGATINDGFVIQPGVAADGLGLPEEYGAIAVGAWGNIDIADPYDSGQQTSQFSEIDWYGSYSLPSLVDGLDFYIGYCEYTYPGSGDATTAPTPADKEVNLGVGYDVGETGTGVAASLYSMIGGSLVGQYYADVSASYGYSFTEELEASVGALVSYIDQGKNIADFAAGGADSGLNTMEFNGTVSYALGDVWSVGASITYIGQLDDQVLVDVDKGGSYDVDLVGMLSVGAFF